MSVTSVERDTDALTMTIVAEFDASVERVWQMWANPRLLERWWGPRIYPATLITHDLSPGGTVHYTMPGPADDDVHGYFRILSTNPPHGLEFENGYADERGTPNPAMPTMIILVTIDERSAGRTRMAVQTTFSSPDSMEQMISLGMEDGMADAIGQIDELVGLSAAP